MYIPKYDTQNNPLSRLQLVMKLWTKLSKFIKCHCLANEKENVIVQLWGLVNKQPNVPSLSVDTTAMPYA